MLTYMLTGSLLDVDFVFDVCNGSTLIPHDVGAVAVLDGSKLNVIRDLPLCSTNFSKKISS